MRSFIKLFAGALKQFYRDRTNPTIMVVVPVLFIAFFGFVYADRSPARLSVGAAGLETAGPVGARLLSVLRADSSLDLHRGDQRRELAALRRGDRLAVVVAGGGSGRISVHYDAADPSAARTALALLDRDLLLASGAALREPLAAHVAEHGTVVRGIDFVVPGILGLALMWLGIFSAIPLVIQREQGVLTRYGLTPVSRVSVIGAQAASRLVVALFQALLLLLAGALLFHVPMRGNPAALVGVVALGALTFVALGYLIAALTPTQEAVHGWTQLVSFPMMLLAGVFFPIGVMPGFLQPVILILPLTYLTDALRQIVLRTGGVAPLAVDVAVLGLWSAASIVLAARFFRWGAATA